MNKLSLSGCTATPFGSFLKSLGVLRLISEQEDSEARASWFGDTFVLLSNLNREDLLVFLLERYAPTPIVAPWNGGSGFYEKDRKIGIDAISSSTAPRFSEYRKAIEFIRSLDDVRRGKADKNQEDDRRQAILLDCRNNLPDSAVEWLDAAVGIAADGSRAFAPVLGTGGNEGRLDYTNNFMERLAGLLIAPDKRTPVRELLANALFGEPASGLQAAAAGQFDPGRAGGANQGQGVESDGGTNPWDFVLTLEGAVAWASGLYRRQGVSYRSFLCSPFTVTASNVGYGSSSSNEDARAEIWAPLWSRPARYVEVKSLLREGRASVESTPARTGLQFAEAVCSLGVDRGIDRFVRYSLLKRRGDSYVALPAGTFPTGYRSSSDRVRQIEALLAAIDREKLPSTCEPLRRKIEAAAFQALLRDRSDRVREVVACLGRLLRVLVTKQNREFPRAPLGDAADWLQSCDAENCPEVRIAAALASIYDADTGPIRDQLVSSNRSFSWFGRNLAERVISVLNRRLLLAKASPEKNGRSDKPSVVNPFKGYYEVESGDATRFIERSVDDELIEDLLFGFCCLRNWRRSPNSPQVEALPVYAVLKHLFLPECVSARGEEKAIPADPRVLSLLRAKKVGEAAEIAVYRLRVAGLNPIEARYESTHDADRIAAALLIPIRIDQEFRRFVLHEQDAAT